MPKQLGNNINGVIDGSCKSNAQGIFRSSPGRSFWLPGCRYHNRQTLQGWTISANNLLILK